MRTRSELDSAFSSREALDKTRQFVLVGIAGAGMSGIARMLRNRGYEVRGTDLSASDEFTRLVSEGFEVHLGHTGEPVEPGWGLVVTDAIDLKTSPEVKAAKEHGCPIFRRSQVLAWLIRDKKTIAVTGTHGKTTTTAMIGSALRACGLDPSIIVGAHVPEFDASVIEGEGDYAVVEACEAYDSLRDFEPHIVVLTNLEPDHLDFHGDWEGLKGAVEKFLKRIPAEGKMILCADDPGNLEVCTVVPPEKVITYSKDDSLPNDLTAPGLHNRLNAQAALLTVDLVGGDRAKALGALQKFGGAERRLQTALDGEITVIDDYAHHPKEIDASLQALRERYPYRRLVTVFQPHLYSRTADFLPEFARSLSASDRLVITDIYPAREAPMPGMSSARIAELVTCEVDYVPSRYLLPRFVKDMVKPGDVVVGMGAGNISDFVPDFVNELNRPKNRKVLVAYGGDSAEREVSLHSGRAIFGAIKRKGYDVHLADLSELLLKPGSLDRLAGTDRPDAVFLAVHGSRAEDGAVQGLLEMLHLPYTGSDIQTSAVTMDKRLTKSILAAHGIRVPFGTSVRKGEKLDESKLPEGKLIVKPNAQGSTVGLFFIEDRSKLTAAIEKSLHYDDEVLIEEWIEGTEISVPVLCGEVLPVVEITPRDGKYDFASKYEIDGAEEICPARISPELTAKAQQIALSRTQIFGCQGACRTDMIVTENEIVVLEVNTLPGMTQTSLLPKSALAAGISFDDLCERILSDAFKKAKTTGS